MKVVRQTSSSKSDQFEGWKWSGGTLKGVPTSPLRFSPLASDQLEQTSYEIAGE
jgi:hypothetical protein